MTPPSVREPALLMRVLIEKLELAYGGVCHARQLLRTLGVLVSRHVLSLCF